MKRVVNSLVTHLSTLVLLAGAAAVEVGAANLIDPYACKKIIEDLPRAMEKYGINNLSEIIGGAHNG